MDFIERYKQDVEYVEKLKNDLAVNTRIKDAYDEEVAPLLEKIEKIGEKYDIKLVNKKIYELQNNIKDTKHSRYIFFLECLYDIQNRCYKEDLNFDLVDFLGYKEIDLYHRFELNPIDEDTYVEGSSVFACDIQEGRDFELIDFEREFSVDELANILNEIEMAINCEKLLKLILEYKHEKLILEKIPDILSGLGISYIADVFYTGSVYIENNEGVITAYSANKIYELLKFKSDVDLNNVILKFEEKMNKINDEIQNDKDYQEYLRLKNKFE